MPFLKKMSLITLMMIFAASAFANEARFLSFSQTNLKETEAQTFDYEDEAYNTITSIEVRELTPEASDYVYDDPNKNIGDVIMTIEKLIALGKKIWTIVEAGRPVSSTNFADAISVLPNIDGTGRAFYEMENWSAPRIKKYRVTYKNLFGMTVVGFTYTVHWQWGGTYEGKGAYLTGLTVSASDISVAWGYKFNASSKLVAIANRGSLNNPVAGSTITIDYVASSVLKEIRSSESFHVTGRGELTKY